MKAEGASDSSIGLASIGDRPQRRMLAPDFELEQRDSKSETHANLYLAMQTSSSSVLPNPKLDDLDPIYTYDLNGNRTSMIDPTGLTTYSYDALNRLTSMTNNQGQITTFTYDALGRRTSTTHANGVVTNYTYDAASQLLSIAHRLGAIPLNSFNYTYEKLEPDSADIRDSKFTYDA
jgi:YD repeat-containing protein